MPNNCSELPFSASVAVEHGNTRLPRMQPGRGEKGGGGGGGDEEEDNVPPHPLPLMHHMVLSPHPAANGGWNLHLGANLLPTLGSGPSLQ